MNRDDWVLDTLDRLVAEDFYGRWIIEFKAGRITLMRFEKTELPPSDLVDD